MAIDEHRIHYFLSSSPIRDEIASVVRRAGFTITWVMEQNRSHWGLYLKPNRPLRETFGINQEILLWVSEYSEFQAKAISQAQQAITDDPLRLCDDFGIIVTADHSTTEYVKSLTQLTQQQFVGFALDEFLAFRSAPPDRFIFAIQKQFFTKDLYNVTNVITTRRAFFGREPLVQQMRDVLLAGTSHVALFGIRKMGKTSTLFRLMDELKSTPHLCIAHVDMQRLDAVRPTAEYFIWTIGEHLFSGNPHIRSLKSLHLLGKHDRFPTHLDSADLFESFDTDIETITNETSIKILLMIDELELMSPETHGSAWGDSYIRAWRLLRGIDQTHPGRLRFVVTGTNPRCIEVNSLGGKENPTYNYFTLHFLKPLAPPESATLLSSLGVRMGLLWNRDTLQKSHSLVGGHPLLLRLLGSAIHAATLPRPNSIPVTETVVDSVVVRFLSRISSSLSQMIEVIGDSYPDELMLLKLLAAGKIGEYREYAMTFPNEVSHLREYGLLAGSPAQERISIDVLQTWLQQRRTGPLLAAQASQSGEFEVGMVVDSYRIEGTIGQPGGFGRVYKAFWQDPGVYVALKIFHKASLEQLEREVDVLKSVSHSCIVKILDHGKLATGHVYLAMELIDGFPLRMHCNRAMRFSAERTSQICKKILNALIAIHPNSERTKALREKDELTNEEYQELNRAMDGYVHRDINPNNILIRNCSESSDPVLIDFGISCKVNTRVITTSGTLGYRPPDGHSVRWSVDTDLYALGLTLAQCLVGQDLTADGCEDIRKAVATENAGIVGDVILRLCAEREDERFSSATEALAVLCK